jgi:hypothetical protein
VARVSRDTVEGPAEARFARPLESEWFTRNIYVSPSKFPLFIPTANAFHSGIVYVRIGPSGCLESLMAIVPFSAATSMHAPPSQNLLRCQESSGSAALVDDVMLPSTVN